MLETDKPALEKAKSFLQIENNPGELIHGGVDLLNFSEDYDVVYTSHTNYYWGANEEHFKLQLDNILNAVKKDGKLLILTLPEHSGHYKVMLYQIYPKFNYSEYIENYYKQKGCNVEIIEFKMRIYVGDILENSKEYDLAVFYKFIHNTNVYPEKDNLAEFRIRLEEFSENGYLNFKDHLIVINK